MTKEQENRSFENPIFQQISFPPSGVVEALYYRKSAWYEDEMSVLESGEGIRILEGCEVRFDTWFNGFEIGKWRRYTNIGTVHLELKFRGTFTIRLFTLLLENEQVTEKNLSEETLVSDGVPVRVKVPESANEGMLAFSVRPENSAGVFLGGAYIAEIREESLRDVNIAVDISTYKREKYIRRIIRQFEEHFLKNMASPLYGHLNLYIQDNGQTLPYDELNTESIHVVPNRNTGGSGAFTRGMLETLDHLDRFPAAHIILMDDDVLISPESFERLYTFLRCLKPEYEDVIIGGAMLELEQPTIRYIDRPLEKVRNLLLKETETGSFAPWWFCCMPVDCIQRNDLPMPFFIKQDDWEFSLRKKRKKIGLNGVSVWHEGFTKKQFPYLLYYMVRNTLFVHGIHFPEKSLSEIFRKYRKTVWKEIMRMRYTEAEYIIRGARDFLKGISFLEETDPPELNTELLALYPKRESLTGFLEKGCYIWQEKDRLETSGDRLIRRITLNGLLLPVKEDDRGIRVIPDGEQSEFVDCYRQKSVIYADYENGKGFKAERDTRRAFRLLWEYEKTLCELKKNEVRLKTEIKRDQANVTSEAFWRKTLQITHREPYK